MTADLPTQGRKTRSTWTETFERYLTILDYIAARAAGMPPVGPTFAEIVTDVDGVEHVSTVQAAVSRLEELGWIRVHRNDEGRMLARGLSLTGAGAAMVAHRAGDTAVTA